MSSPPRTPPPSRLRRQNAFIIPSGSAARITPTPPPPRAARIRSITPRRIVPFAGPNPSQLYHVSPNVRAHFLRAQERLDEIEEEERNESALLPYRVFEARSGEGRKRIMVYTDDSSEDADDEASSEEDSSSSVSEEMELFVHLLVVSAWK